MDDWTRVLLYGTFDGFTYSTDDFPRTVVVLDSGERVEVPEECVVSADRMINKNKIKLKDVIARIKKLDICTQKVWLNEILNELGSDYGTLKYKAGYEQGKFDGTMEREKVKVPQFVADYIRYAIENDWDFQDLFGCIEDEEDEELLRWFYHERNQETIASAWINGYTIEKEPKYTVKCKATKQYLSNDELGPHFDPIFRSNFTKSDLEKLGLGWVLECEGMEVEKVGK